MVLEKEFSEWWSGKAGPARSTEEITFTLRLVSNQNRSCHFGNFFRESVSSIPRRRIQAGARFKFVACGRIFFSKPEQDKPDMPMYNLQMLEDVLRRQLPAFEWHCRAVNNSRFIPTTEIPEQIEVAATRDGTPVTIHPWHLSGHLLLRWGLDATAHLLCKEHVGRLNDQSTRTRLSWDKLSEL